MPDQPKVSERAIAELVAQVGRLAYGDEFAAGLTPAQWTALRYFSSANRFSRTVSALLFMRDPRRVFGILDAYRYTAHKPRFQKGLF